MAEEWNGFVAKARNGTFLLDRRYMEYHSDRFLDHSLIFRIEGEFIGALAANRVGEKLISHAGLTYGGLIVGPQMKGGMMLEAFRELLRYAKISGVREIVYKAVPHIYHSVPAEEDLYALFRCGASLMRRDISSVVPRAARFKFSKGRKSCISKATKAGVVVRRSLDFQAFMLIEEQHLGEKHGTKPVHTAEEIALLAARFPKNIELFAAFLGSEMLGGVIVYVSEMVVHAQYIAATEGGKRLGVLDLVLSELLTSEFVEKPFFDFGISTRDQGLVLDCALLSNKESFGARAVCYDWYHMDVGASLQRASEF